MQAGRYLLAKFSSRKELLHAAELLDKSRAVKRWNAVDGFYSLVVRTEGDDTALVSDLEKLNGFGHLLRCEVIKDNESDEVFGDDLCHAYLFMEVDRKNKAALVERLTTNPLVAYCSETSGAFDLVCLTSADNFDTIDRAVAEEIRQYDGILRLKQDRVIHLDRM
jgi:hypothetical protein